MSPTAWSGDGWPRRVAHLDTGREWRGGQSQVLLLMRGLERRGVKCHLLAPRGPLLARAHQHGLATHGWSSGGDWDVPGLVRAAWLLRRIRPDVVHCHSARAHALGVPAARLAGVPVVVVSRRVAVRVRRGLKYRLPVDRYLCVSRGVLDAMRAAGVPERRLALVPSGVALDDPAPADDLRVLIDAPRDAPVVGTAAALTSEKRHEDLLAAAEVVRDRVPDVRFAWVGEGRRRAWLERERDARGLSGCVHFLGFRPDARGLMNQCTVVALASDLEGVSTMLVDAQAAGVPVVATAVGGVPEVVTDGRTGRLVAARDPAALAGALIELLTDPRMRAAMGREGATAARQFHIDRTVERTVEEYGEALKSRQGAA